MLVSSAERYFVKSRRAARRGWISPALKLCCKSWTRGMRYLLNLVAQKVVIVSATSGSRPRTSRTKFRETSQGIR